MYSTLVLQTKFYISCLIWRQFLLIKCYLKSSRPLSLSFWSERNYIPFLQQQQQQKGKRKENHKPPKLTTQQHHLWCSYGLFVVAICAVFTCILGCSKSTSNLFPFFLIHWIFSFFYFSLSPWASYHFARWHLYNCKGASYLYTSTATLTIIITSNLSYQYCQLWRAVFLTWNISFAHRQVTGTWNVFYEYTKFTFLCCVQTPFIMNRC